VDIDIESVLGLELQRCLHPSVGEDRSGRVALVCLAVFGYNRADAGKRSDVVLILLRIVVAGNPVGGMVGGHRKLGVLLLYHEIVERLLLRKLVAQSHAIVVNAETDGDVAVGGGLVQVDGHLVVVVADGCGLTPHGSPCLVEGRGLRGLNLETVHQVGLFHAFRGVLVSGKLQSEVGRVYHLLVLVFHFVCGLALV
jgi:hypothetical protein